MNPTRPLQLDANTYGRALDCVQCGLCLPDCPTYTQTGLETDSPRGRIRLMKAAADGRIALADEVAGHLDLCLDCRACETACPSGVVYHELIEASRIHLAHRHRGGWSGRLVAWFIAFVFPRPRWLRWALLPARLLQAARLWPAIVWLIERLGPAGLARMAALLPRGGPIWPRRPHRHYVPRGPRRRTVGYFAGCVGSVIQPNVQRCTIELLQEFGCEVFCPTEQVCCGAIDHHDGRVDAARALARRNLAAFAGCDVVVTDIAGCGAMLKSYARLFDADPAQRDLARQFADRVRDINEFLADLALPIPPHSIALRATYHDACHLAHAQAITAAPRRLLRMIDGLELVDLVESDTCCGAAGTYNLTRPAMADDLARRKIEHIRRTGCQVVITANVGCALQIESSARRAGLRLQVVHPVQMLHRAYMGPGSPNGQ